MRFWIDGVSGVMAELQNIVHEKNRGRGLPVGDVFQESAVVLFCEVDITRVGTIKKVCYKIYNFPNLRLVSLRPP